MSTVPLGLQPKAVRRQEGMVLVVTLGMFASGMALGLPAVTLNQLTDPNQSIHLSKSQASWYASINTITCPIGALITAVIMDKIGRKKTIITVNIIDIIAWGLMAVSVYGDSQAIYIQLIVSRCVTGVANGMGSSPSGVYGAEICLPQIRSRLILSPSLSVAMGVLCVYIVGYFIRNDFRLIALVLLIYQVFCTTLLFPVPETPNWLLMKGRAVEAKKALTYFRGLEEGQTHDEVEAEFAVLQHWIMVKGAEEKVPFRQALRLPEVYKPLLIMIGLFACQQFSGIFVVVVYAVQISTEAGINIDPILCAILIGLARVVVTCLMCWLLELWGRRLTAIISAIGMVFSMFFLAAERWFPSMRVPYLSAVALIAYIITSTLGLLTLPFFMISEVFPQKVRGACAGITAFFGMIMAFCALKMHPWLMDEISMANIFAFYGLMSLLSLAFVYVFLPETKGKTLIEIEEYFRGGKKNTA